MTTTIRKALCTGSAGFIGGHLVKELKAKGVPTVGLDNRYDEDTDEKGKVYGDIRSLSDMVRAVNLIKPDAVFHLAAFASVRDSMARPEAYIKNNILGTFYVLESIRQWNNSYEGRKLGGVKYFVNVSSGGTVYGEKLKLPISVTETTYPLDIYGLTKLTNDHMVRILCHNMGVKHFNLRYPNVYGEGQDPYGEAGVVAIFARKMLDGHQVTINGDGRQTRDFMYVADVVKATIDAVNQLEGDHNIGTGLQTSVNEVFKILKLVSGYDGEAKHGDSKQGEVRSISLRPSFPMEYTPLEEGLTNTLSWFRTHKSAQMDLKDKNG